LIVTLLTVCVAYHGSSAKGADQAASAFPSELLSERSKVPAYRIAQAPAPQPSTPSGEIPKNAPPDSTEKPSAFTVTQVSYKTPWEVYLTGFTVVLGLGFLALFCYAHRGPMLDHAFARNFIILTVIFSALFLIVAGYSERQTAPVFGLLGTIIGYLFGVATGKAQAQEQAAIEAAPKSAQPANKGSSK
jgi:hypothetical protein